MTAIALTGSTGALGGRVARLLGPRVGRLVVRDAAVAALRGVDVLLMVSASESPTRRQEHRTFIAAAAEAGVGHLVYTSFVGAAADATFTLGRDHADAEAAIAATGIPSTILRDNFYAEALPLFAGEERVIRGPAGSGRVAVVARADVADVAAVVLADAAAHAGRVYALTGPEALTLDEAALRLTAALGAPYAFEDQTLDEAYASRLPWSTEQWQLDAWVSTYTAIRDGEVAAVADDVERLTGHPARRLEDALRGA